MTNRNCLSFWFPLIRDAGLPVPETRIIKTDIHLSKLLDGRKPDGWKGFVSELASAGGDFGYPFFLRTGQGSGKHNWEHTCYVSAKDQIGQHVFNLVEWSECADFMGLPYNVWAVRELLPTNPVCVLPVYGNMPLCREFRCFVRDGECICVHPYWPWESVCEGFPGKPDRYRAMLDEPDDCTIEESRQLPDGLQQTWRTLCSMMGAERDEIRSLASRAGAAVGDYWSVDILETSRGWYLTDMALGEQSFHWPGCKNAVIDCPYEGESNDR